MLRYSDLGGISGILQEVRELIEYPLVHPEVYAHLGIEPVRWLPSFSNGLFVSWRVFSTAWNMVFAYARKAHVMTLALLFGIRSFGVVSWLEEQILCSDGNLGSRS